MNPIAVPWTVFNRGRGGTPAVKMSDCIWVYDKLSSGFLAI